jgi:hypothetical protein
VSTDVDLGLVLITNKNRIGIYQRSGAAKFLKNTAGFSTFLCHGKSPIGDGFTGSLDLRQCSKIGSIKHHITHHNIRANIYVASREQGIGGFGKIKWLERDLVEKNLVSNLDRKAWTMFLKNQPSEMGTS